MTAKVDPAKLCSRFVPVLLLGALRELLVSPKASRLFVIHDPVILVGGAPGLHWPRLASCGLTSLLSVLAILPRSQTPELGLGGRTRPHSPDSGHKVTIINYPDHSQLSHLHHQTLSLIIL